MTDLVIRALTMGEEDHFESLPDPGLMGSPPSAILVQGDI